MYRRAFVKSALPPCVALTDSIQTTYEPFKAPPPNEVKKLPADTCAEMGRRSRRDQHGLKGGGNGRLERKNRHQRGRVDRQQEKQRRDRDELADEFEEGACVAVACDSYLSSASGAWSLLRGSSLVGSFEVAEIRSCRPTRALRWVDGGYTLDQYSLKGGGNGCFEQKEQTTEEQQRQQRRDPKEQQCRDPDELEDGSEQGR